MLSRYENGLKKLAEIDGEAGQKVIDSLQVIYCGLVEKKGRFAAALRGQSNWVQSNRVQSNRVKTQ